LFNCSAFYVLGLVVLGANMGCKRLVALQLKVLHYFIKGIARASQKG
jgi:hypothetical protein